MSDAARSKQAEVFEHRGYQIRLSQTRLEWTTFVALPKQRPTLIMAPDREAVIAKVDDWVAAQLQSAKCSP
jgi:alpha-beta hydrolase superfamily lysophospholipase